MLTHRFDWRDFPFVSTTQFPNLFEKATEGVFYVYGRLFHHHFTKEKEREVTRTSLSDTVVRFQIYSQETQSWGAPLAIFRIGPGDIV